MARSKVALTVHVKEIRCVTSGGKRSLCGLDCQPPQRFEALRTNALRSSVPGKPTQSRTSACAPCTVPVAGPENHTMVAAAPTCSAWRRNPGTLTTDKASKCRSDPRTSTDGPAPEMVAA